MLTPKEIANLCPEDWEIYKGHIGKRVPKDVELWMDAIQGKAQARKERDVLKQALVNIRKKCFDDSQWGRYIDKVLTPSAATHSDKPQDSTQNDSQQQTQSHA